MSNELEQVIGAPIPDHAGEIEAQAAAYVVGRDPGEAWSITTIGEADWALRKLMEIRQHEQAYADEIALWTAARDRALRAGQFFADALERWGVEQRIATKTKTFPLAHGTISTRSSAPRLVITDEDAALNWLRACEPDAIRTTEKALISAVTTVAIGTVIVGFEATNKTTGEVEQQMLDLPQPNDPERIAAVAAKLGDEWAVRPITEPAAVATVSAPVGTWPPSGLTEGQPVLGFGVSDERISATVTPLGI